ncbi:MAG TPA: class I SAM-dependent methyltransferase [Pirellulales bacterium]|nr:class I SAM-dependent methyltransferase [Pirellulales bacterium]
MKFDPDADVLDSPETTIERGLLIRDKPLLRRFYGDCYAFFAEVARDANGPRIELGSGAGFLDTVVPGVIRSDLLRLPDIDLVARAENLPFADGSLSAIFLLNALHHIPDVRSFIGEAARCLKSGGMMAMIEPANTVFSRFIYRNFHHEPFLPAAADWCFPAGRPLSMANGALPWIVFVRDRETFDREFPELSVRRLEYCCPFTYLLSGGLSYPQLVPSFLSGSARLAERLLAPFNPWLGMFMRVVVAKR